MACGMANFSQNTTEKSVFQTYYRYKSSAKVIKCLEKYGRLLEKIIFTSDQVYQKTDVDNIHSRIDHYQNQNQNDSIFLILEPITINGDLSENAVESENVCVCFDNKTLAKSISELNFLWYVIHFKDIKKLNAKDWKLKIRIYAKNIKLDRLEEICFFKILRENLDAFEDIPDIILNYMNREYSHVYNIPALCEDFHFTKEQKDNGVTSNDFGCERNAYGRVCSTYPCVKNHCFISSTFKK